jgi:hypothetical protein
MLKRREDLMAFARREIKKADKKTNKQDCGNIFMISAILAVSLLSGMFVMLLDAGVGDADYYWHNKLGGYIVDNKSLMTQDTFSWLSIQNGYTEYAHSWLGSVLIYFLGCLGKLLFGRADYGAILVSGIGVCLTVGATYWFFIRRFKKETTRFLLLMATLCLCLISTKARPQAFSTPLFIILIGLLYRMKGWKDCLYIGIITILWANIHGGTVLIVPAFAGFFLILSAIPNFEFYSLSHTKKDNKTILNYGIALAACFAASCLNPFGVKLYTYAFGTNSSSIKSYVAEWKPAALISPIVLISILIIILTLLVAKKIRLSVFIILIGSMMLSAIRIRYSLYLGMFCVPAMCITFEGSEFKKTFAMKKIMIYLCIVGALMFFNLQGHISTGDNRIVKNSNLPSKELVSEIKEKDYKRLYSSYDIGGYLIFNDIPSFVDSRADLFGADNIRNAIYFDHFTFETKDDFKEFLEKFDFDGILLSAKSPTSTYLADYGYKKVSEDENFILFEKMY